MQMHVKGSALAVVMAVQSAGSVVGELLKVGRLQVLDLVAPGWIEAEETASGIAGHQELA